MDMTIKSGLFGSSNGIEKFRECDYSDVKFNVYSGPRQNSGSIHKTQTSLGLGVIESCSNKTRENKSYFDYK